MAVFAGALIAPQAAGAAITSALGIPCTTQGDGVRFCGSDTPRSTVASPVDGVPIDVNVAFPAATGTDTNYPLVMMFHGYGGQKASLAEMHRWLDKGYAVFSMTDRGFHESCGSAASRTAAGAACDDGYVRLIDNRFEVRDAQDFAGLLADEGTINGQKIGAIGGSYGGGLSMALAALKNRVVNQDYSLSPWTSPLGKPMQIAAAAPDIPWTDLAYSLAPNGSTLDYVADAPYLGRIGVEKQSFVTGLYLSGQAAPGYYAPTGTDPTADLTKWRNDLNTGEPYGNDVLGAILELSQHHSSYAINHSVAPAPLLMSSGFTDDLFPADETIRFYNRTRTQYPAADMSLFFGDFGHMRGQNKADVTGALRTAENAWFDFYIKGQGTKPANNVTAYTQTCPAAAPSGGPYVSSSWATAAPGEIQLRPNYATQYIAPDSSTGGDFNPVPAGDPCQKTASINKPGSAVYEFPEVPDGGYTLLGSPTIQASFSIGKDSEVAARLLDQAPDGSETLVARGLWRPGTQSVFQLHPNGYHFDSGHVPKLELLAADGVRPADALLLGSYGRPSDNQESVGVSNVGIQLPVAEKPGSLEGTVKAPLKKTLPQGYELAKDFADLPDSEFIQLASTKFKLKDKAIKVKLDCPASFDSCNDVRLDIDGYYRVKKKDGDKKNVDIRIKKQVATIPGGTVTPVKIELERKLRLHLMKVGDMHVGPADVSSAEVSHSERYKKIVLLAVKKKGGKGHGGKGGGGGKGGNGGGGNGGKGGK